MPVHIRNVDADLRALPTPGAASQTTNPPRDGLHGMSDAALRERLRPLVLDILRRELEELRRRRGS
jgi:hypothetical protein